MSPERKRVRASSIRPREGALTLFSHPFFLNAKKQDMKHIFHFSIGFISQRPNSCSREGLSGVEIVCFKVSTFDRASGILEDSFELRSKLFCSFSFFQARERKRYTMQRQTQKTLSCQSSRLFVLFQLSAIYQATACSRRPPRDRTLALALLQAERWGEA